MTLAAPLHDRERPRERLGRLGPRALSLHELVTLVIGTGTAGASASELARRVLEHASTGDGESLRSSDFDALTLVPGVGPMSAARLCAALELGRRVAGRDGRRGEPRIRGPEDVHRRMGPVLRDLHHEEFHALLLDTRHRVLREVLVTRGILDASLIHPREVFRPAVREGAAAVIVVHNHPSGDPAPSAEDRQVTRQLADAGSTLGIPLLDHVIIGDGRWASVSRD